MEQPLEDVPNPVAQMQMSTQKLFTLALHMILRHLPSGPPGPQQSSESKLESSGKTHVAEERGAAQSPELSRQKDT